MATPQPPTQTDLTQPASHVDHPYAPRYPPPSAMPEPNIFINYRRSDTEGFAIALYGDLNQKYPSQIFMDRMTLEVGRKYESDIERSLHDCAILIVLIGPNWLSVQNKDGSPRLFDTKDILRTEIGVALKRNIPVIPLLVGHVPMPSRADLPPEIAELAEYNATHLYADDWPSSITRLCRTIDARLAEHPHTQPIAVTAPIAESPEISPPQSAPPPVEKQSTPPLPKAPPQGSTPQPALTSATAHANSPTASQASPSTPVVTLPAFLRARRLTILGATLLLLLIAFLAVVAFFSHRNAERRRVWVMVSKTNTMVRGVRDGSWTLALHNSWDYANGLQWSYNDFHPIQHEPETLVIPQSWQALEAIKDLNRQHYGAYGDWRLPTTAELETLCGTSERRSIYQSAFASPHSSVYFSGGGLVPTLMNCTNGNLESGWNDFEGPPAGTNPTVRAVRGSLRYP